MYLSYGAKPIVGLPPHSLPIKTPGERRKDECARLMLGLEGSTVKDAKTENGKVFKPERSNAPNVKTRATSPSAYCATTLTQKGATAMTGGMNTKLHESPRSRK